MRAMARTPDGDRRSLIELKAVDAAYPLYGAVRLSPEQSLATALGRRDGSYGAAVDAAVLSRLGLAIGDNAWVLVLLAVCIIDVGAAAYSPFLYYRF